jgi:predicted O-methyltransferase YrrM
MPNINTVTQKLSGIKYMNQDQAMVLREHINKHDLSNILEIGFYQGKSTAYLAAILNERGEGHVTTIDKASAQRHEPGIFQNLEAVGLSRFVTAVFSERSYTWELGKMVASLDRPQFDLCYFDGGHTWDMTGFGFVLVDLLIRPGGWIIFDDLDWTIETSPAAIANSFSSYRNFSVDERRTPAVRMVFENLVPEKGYTNTFERDGWGFAQKPLTP